MPDVNDRVEWLTAIRRLTQLHVVGLQLLDLLPDANGLALLHLVPERLLAALAPRVRLPHQLRRRLPEVADHALGGVTLHRVRDRVQVDGALVRAVP